MKKEHFWILVTSFVVLGIVLFAQYTFGDKHPESFLTSLLPNFFADVISILITTYLLAYLLQKNQEKKEKQQLYDVIKQDYIKFIHKVAGNYLYLITRNEEFINSDACGLSEMRKEIVRLKGSRELIDSSTMMKNQGEIKNILYGKWRTSFMKFNPHFQTYIDQHEIIQIKIEDILRKYLNEDLMDDFDNMRESDKEMLKHLENEMVEFGDNSKLPFITAKFMAYYHDYAVEKISDFIERYQIILPQDMKMALFSLKSNLHDTVMYSMTYAAYGELSQEKKEKIQNTMMNITKEISYLIDYYKEFE